MRRVTHERKGCGEKGLARERLWRGLGKKAQR